MLWDKKQYCLDLIKFSEIIERYDDTNYLASGLGILHSIANQFEYSQATKIKIDGIELNIHKKISGTIPLEVDSFSINIDCMCDIDLHTDPSKYDIITQYALQLEIIGYAGDKRYYNCWHLDKDIPPKEGDSHNHTHPSYHFQMGGYRIEGLDTGEMLFLGAPRLPHPPMDIFLVIHFVLGNFFSKKDFPFIDALFEDFDYQNILERAKKRMFTPYFQAFHIGCTHQDFNLQKIFPMAV
jgi:hypothetical protein